ncbi:MAG: GNAT family N-acetyltransferase [Sediminibacterium magnilacihabitans]|jgi:hypothetical protein|nr:GNAT family N-acetyltransferase [Sediminibacterium magnilacihabitans]
MIKIKRVTEMVELQGILQLQQENLKKNVSAGEAGSEGFVTAEYTLAFLEAMHRASPSVIAKDGDRVVGYALVAVKSVGKDHDLLADLFHTIDQKRYKDVSLKDARYVVVGQLCVAKGYRGMGLVQQLYRHFREVLSGEFDYCLTDIAQENARSLKAHLKTGFQVLDTLNYGGMIWDIVLWDWK